MARNGEKKLGLMSVMSRDCPPMAFSDRIHAVAVVPRFAPIIRPIALLNAIIPEFTRPTVRTVVAEADCTRAVMTAPKRNARNRFFVTFPIRRFREPPVIAARESLIAFMPARNSASPPSMEEISIRISIVAITINLVHSVIRFPVPRSTARDEIKNRIMPARPRNTRSAGSSPPAREFSLSSCRPGCPAGKPGNQTARRQCR